MQSKARTFSLLAAILMLITVLISDINYIFSIFKYDFFDVGYLFEFLGRIGFIVLLFANNKKLAVIPSAAMCVSAIIATVSNFHIINVLFFLKEASIMLLLLATTVLSDKIDKGILKYARFAPIAIYVLHFVIRCFYLRYFITFGMIVVSVLNIAINLLLGLWAADMFVPSMHSTDTTQAYTTSANTQSTRYGYCDLLTHVLLLLFTFGIWQYIWIYKTTAFLNSTPNEECKNPTASLLLCMFIPFYYLYWIYKNASRIDKLGAANGVHGEISTLCLVLAFFVDIIPPILMQDKINNITKATTTGN